MKTLTTILSVFFTLILFNLNGQCPPSSGQYILSNQNQRFLVNTNGNLWFNGDDHYYENPIGSEKHTMFAGGLWMGGTDDGGNLHLAANSYGLAAGNTDFWPGPIPLDGDVPAILCNRFDMLFPAESEEITAHRQDWNDNGVIDNSVPENILSWPAVGNPHFEELRGFELPEVAGGLAPFYDVNNNGLYEPMQGDYPLINGDHALWMVYNDVGNVHSETTGTIPIGMEIQLMAYLYDSGNDVIDNTSFYEYKLIYKGVESLNDFYLGFWMDPDIGCENDDFIGCLPEENLAYAYNGNENDECQEGYGTIIPMVGVKTIREGASAIETDMSGFVYYLNASTSPTLNDPDIGPEYYNYLKGYWKNGSPFTQGGNGYTGSFGDPYPFAFDESIVDNEIWTECTEDSQPGDRRCMMNFGGETLFPGAVSRFTYAVYTKQGVDYPCPTSDDILSDMQSIESFDQSVFNLRFNDGLPPVALFNPENQPGTMGYQFFDLSFNNPESWLWNFGDGTISTEQLPTHTFAEAGTYNVCLVVTNTEGSNAYCQELEVTVMQAPEAAFSYTTQNTIAFFTDESTNSPTSWSWDFGDGTTGEGEEPFRFYIEAGVYNVCLTATNSVGSDTYCEDIMVGTVATNNLDFGFDYQLSPNPASSDITFQFEEMIPNNLIIDIYDVAGRRMDFSKTESTNGISISVQDFSSGIYFYQLRIAENAEVEYGKFIVE